MALVLQNYTKKALCRKCGKWGIIKWKRHPHNRYYLYVLHKYNPEEYRDQKKRGLKRPNGSVYHKYNLGVDGREKMIDANLIDYNIDWNQSNKWIDHDQNRELTKIFRRTHPDRED
jgi:hypothetical protein